MVISALKNPSSYRAKSLAHSVLLIAALTGCATAKRDVSAPSTATRPPNILVLYTDDQGFGDCGALNPEAKFATPHMDRLAREGLSLTDAHSAGSVCTPSRYGLLTGRYPWRTPLGGGVLGADAPCMIEDGRTTLATLTRDQGYATAIFGKWHLGLQINGTKGDRDWSAPATDGPLQKGFDTFYGLPASMNFGALTWFDDDRAIEPASLWTRKKFPAAEIVTKPLDYRMAPPFDQERLNPSDIEVAPGFEDVDALRIITEHAVEYIEENADKPFFAYVALTSPHLPHCTAPEFRGLSTMGNYGDFMLETDHRVGEILAALDRLKLAEDTIVILTSDNGPENNYKDWLRLYGHESSGGFRGGKRDVYEGGHRVPFFVRWPRMVEAGRVSNALVGQVDVLATLADVLGADLLEGHGEDSVSFLHLLQDAEPAPSAREWLVNFGRSQYAVRQGRWKLIFARNQDDKRALGAPLELYDLGNDPSESTNVLQDYPEVVESIQQYAHDSTDGLPALLAAARER